jgi:hypothetical protein
MHPRLAELGWASTRIGEISLRRRLEPTTRTEVYEVKLGDEYLMSSLFTVAEEELARLTLAVLPNTPLDVAVGGLGLGYTARTALTDSRVRSLVVVEALAPVIDWHRRDLLPEAGTLTADPRTTLLEGDFFALLRDGTGFDPDAPREVTDEGGYGLRAMRERLSRIPGTLEVESEPGGGTAVSACVPALALGGAA